MTVNKILLATDLTEASHSAESTAMELAGQLQAKLVILHVVQERASLGMSTIPPEMSDAADADTMLQAVASRHAPGAETLLARGAPPQRIVETAREAKADLLVLGTSGRRVLSRAVLGSVAEAVVRDADCPVVLVKPSSEMPSR